MQHAAEEYGLQQMTDAALARFAPGTTLTKHDINQTLNELFPGKEIKAPSLSADLWNRAKDGTLEVVERGADNKPNIYRIPSRGEAAPFLQW